MAQLDVEILGIIATFMKRIKHVMIFIGSIKVLYNYFKNTERFNSLLSLWINTCIGKDGKSFKTYIEPNRGRIDPRIIFHGKTITKSIKNKDYPLKKIVNFSQPLEVIKSYNYIFGKKNGVKIITSLVKRSKFHCQICLYRDSKKKIKTIYTKRGHVYEFVYDYGKQLLYFNSWYDIERRYKKIVGTFDINKKIRVGLWRSYNILGVKVKAGEYSKDDFKNSNKICYYDKVLGTAKQRSIKERKVGVWKKYHPRDGSVIKKMRYIPRYI